MPSLISHWYAIYTKPRWEKKVHSLLIKKKLESYCPLNKVRKKWSDRMKTVEEPLFKSYVFARVNEEEQSTVRMTAGVMNFVYWQGKPAVIPAREIETIRKFLNEYENVIAEPLHLKKDGLVTIRQGLFMDQEAKVLKVEGNRVKVVIESIGYSLIASVDKKNLSTLIHYKRMFSISNLRSFLVFVIGVWIMHLLSSCGNTRNLVYMQGNFDTAQLSQVNPVEPIIRQGDILSIIVYSDNPDATKIYNQSLITTANAGVQSGGTQIMTGTSPAAPGYQVDQKGNIMFQGIGLIHVEGLTKAQLKDTLDVQLTPFLQHPYYNIRFLNYKFTMLGEVLKPGLVSIPGERINLLEAIALAGDLTFYGRRDNILVIRETNNKREFARLDLTKPEIMKSPYFYLQQNDIVIVEPNSKKVAANDVITLRDVSIAATVVSTLAILYSIFRK